jgi:alkanesulfonate monooxygenase SsuD/methylene tetrahydromethanopterin reductase-like flavin-dependent oxidoreductase (luciferase family)
MKVSAGLLFQNAADYFERAGSGAPPASSSAGFREEIRAGELATSIGFEGIWVVEHHFTSHGETPSPLQELTYFAGRAPHVDLGTCVLVLPWNDPVRLAEQVAVLDNLLGPDRTLTIGIGRGAAQSEFDGFEVPLAESTRRFQENAEILQRLLAETNVTFHGKFRSFANLTTLPRPRTDPAELLDRMYCAWGSTSSMEYAAKAGFRPLFNPKGSPEEYAAQILAFNEIRVKDGREPRRPIMSVLVYAEEDEELARQNALKYLRPWAEINLMHYQLLDADHFRAAGNYGDYVARAESMASIPRLELLDSFAANQVYGTPGQCLEKLRTFYDCVSPEELVLVMRFGGMPYEVAEANIRLLADKVIPEVKSWQPRPAEDIMLTRADGADESAPFPDRLSFL